MTGAQRSAASYAIRTVTWWNSASRKAPECQNSAGRVSGVAGRDCGIGVSNAGPAASWLIQRCCAPTRASAATGRHASHAAAKAAPQTARRPLGGVPTSFPGATAASDRSGKRLRPGGGQETGRPGATAPARLWVNRGGSERNPPSHRGIDPGEPAGHYRRVRPLRQCSQIGKIRTCGRRRPVFDRPVRTAGTAN
jgi:hypothetical protein